MNQTKNAFSTLGQQAGRGDASARMQMERDLIPIVRRVIRHGVGTSSLDRRILDEARRWETDERADQDHLIGRVVHSLCASVIAQMRPASSGKRLATETVANFSNPGRCGCA
jgi:hypothetical protein